MDNPFNTPAILSLCTGSGGLERGVERAIGRVRTVAYVEIEAFVIENLVQQMEQGLLAPTPIWSNVKTFPSKQFHNKIHGITGGYPCQPFSLAGNRNGSEDPRHLWPSIRSIVETTRPVWCFFENVPGHLTLGYREVRSDLQRIGYTVNEGIFSAQEVGAPHLRKRLFILAVSNGAVPRLQEWGGKKGICQQRAQTTNGVYAADAGLADTNLCDGGVRSAEIQSEAIEFESTEQRQERKKILRQRSGTYPGASGSQLDHSASQGSQREITTQKSGVPSQSDRADCWPSSPGQPQHQWEPPRLESRLGYVFNGYSFREDLLRMAGNAVVEQQAEKAFRTLMSNFYRRTRNF